MLTPSGRTITCNPGRCFVIWNSSQGKCKIWTGWKCRACADWRYFNLMEYSSLCIVQPRKNSKFLVQHNVYFLSGVQATCFGLIKPSLGLCTRHSKNKVWHINVSASAVFVSCGFPHCSWYYTKNCNGKNTLSGLKASMKPKCKKVQTIYSDLSILYSCCISCTKAWWWINHLIRNLQSVPPKENVLFLTENSIFPRLALFRYISFEHRVSYYQTSFRPASNCIVYCGLLFYTLLILKSHIFYCPVL